MPSARPQPAPPQYAIRSDLAHLLPPRASGPKVLSELASSLRQREAEGRLARADAQTLVAEAFVAAWDVLVWKARRHVRGLSQESAEEVIGNLAARLDRIYGQWHGDGSFGAYLDKATVHEALRVARREGKSDLPLEEVDGSVEVNEERLDAPPAALRVRALLRFAWYLYGSPDNPNRLQYDKAFIDFLALSARLTNRPVAELVYQHQPRPGSWGEGTGEADRKWWRGRATMAQKRLMKALHDPILGEEYKRILLELGGQTADRKGHKRRRSAAS